MCTLVMLGVTVRNVTYSRKKQSKKGCLGFMVIYTTVKEDKPRRTET